MNAHNYGIGLIWPSISSTSPGLAPSAVPQRTLDLGRLLYDYADNSRAFFSDLATRFPQSPAELEMAFRAALSQTSTSPSLRPDRHHLAPLAWPQAAPETCQRQGYTNSKNHKRGDLLAPSPKRCTVSSLLNFEKDTGAQNWGMSGA